MQIFGVADDSTYRDHWPLINANPEAWDKIASGEGALINEQMWRRGLAQPGQTITMPGGWTVTVVGVYSDYGNPKGQVIVGIDTLVAHFPEAPKLRYGLRVPPDRAQHLKRQLVDEFGIPEAAVIDQASLKQQSRAVFEETFTVTGSLNVLTLGGRRVRDVLKLADPFGDTPTSTCPGLVDGHPPTRPCTLRDRSHPGALVRHFIAAIPVGLGLAWVLLAVVNVEAFGWRLPIDLAPKFYPVLSSLQRFWLLYLGR